MEAGLPTQKGFFPRKFLTGQVVEERGEERVKFTEHALGIVDPNILEETLRAVELLRRQSTGGYNDSVADKTIPYIKRVRARGSGSAGHANNSLR